MEIDKLHKALAKTKLPVQRLLYTGTAKTYITYQRILTHSTEFADDEGINEVNTYRVNLFSKGTYDNIIESIVEHLKAEGFEVLTIDAEDYENDTKLFHVPITIQGMEVE